MKLTYNVVFTDGGCRSSGEGAYGIFLITNAYKIIIEGKAFSGTTNNQMELMGVIRALKITNHQMPLKIYTDSMYVINGATKWKDSWILKDYDGVKNSDLWRELHKYSFGRKIEWIWVKGHSGIPGNEVADGLASQVIEFGKDIYDSFKSTAAQVERFINF